MRDTLKKSQSALQNLEMLLGLSATSSSRVFNASELQEKLRKALREREEREESGTEKITVSIQLRNLWYTSKAIHSQERPSVRHTLRQQQEKCAVFHSKYEFGNAIANSFKQEYNISEARFNSVYSF